MAGRNWRAKFVDETGQGSEGPAEACLCLLISYGEATVPSGRDQHPFDFIYAAGHAMEINFFFGADTSLWGYSFSPGNDFEGRMALGDAMMEYVANFARTGKPKGHHLPKWKEWSNKEGKDKVIVFRCRLRRPSDRHER